MSPPSAMLPGMIHWRDHVVDIVPSYWFIHVRLFRTIRFIESVQWFFYVVVSERDVYGQAIR